MLCRSFCETSLTANSFRIATMKRLVIKPAVLLFAITLLLASLLGPLTNLNAQTPLPQRESYQFTNGQWFDGADFRHRVFYSINGVLTLKKPARIDKVFDLKNGYVIP